MTDHKVYAEQMTAKIDEWAAEIDKLQARSGQARAHAEGEYEKLIADLKKRQAEAEANLKKMQAAGEASWADMRRAFETSYDAFAEAARNAAKRF